VREHDVGAPRACDTAVVGLRERLRIVDDDQVERFAGEGGAVTRDALVEARAIDAADDEGEARQGRAPAGAGHRWISSIL
jgi:hypothetical protein